nr:hypothetical protein Iba_chr03aCG22020 [Ipomoea batatas]
MDSTSRFKKTYLGRLHKPLRSRVYREVVYAEKLAGRVVGKGKGRVMGEEFSDPKEQEREDLTMIAKLKNISRIQSSFRDFRPGVGTSQGNAVPKDCDQQEEDEDKKPEKDTSGYNGEAQEESYDSSSSSSSSDSDNNNINNQGASNHPQDVEEPRRNEDGDTHNPNEEDG